MTAEAHLRRNKAGDLVSGDLGDILGTPEQDQCKITQHMPMKNRERSALSWPGFIPASWVCRPRRDR